MRRRIVWGLLLLVGLYLIAQLLQSYQGYVLVEVGPCRLEPTLVTLMILWLLLWCLLLRILRLFGKILHLGGWFRRYRQSRALQQLFAALLKGIEGDYRGAEQLLVRSAVASEQPYLHYLLAAEAARQQAQWLTMQQHLVQIAGTADQPYWLALQISQARLQLATQPLAMARQTITALLRLAPNHPAVRQLAQQLEQSAAVTVDLTCNVL